MNLDDLKLEIEDDTQAISQYFDSIVAERERGFTLDDQIQDYKDKLAIAAADSTADGQKLAADLRNQIEQFKGYKAMSDATVKAMVEAQKQLQTERDEHNRLLESGEQLLNDLRTEWLSTHPLDTTAPF